METIVVVYIQTPGARFFSDQASVASSSYSSQASVGPHTMKKIDNRKSSQHDQAIPPFWTWFIENPRSNPA